MGRVILSRGHNGTGGRPGASYTGLSEEILVRTYMIALEDTLRAAGHDVVIMSGFPYSARHRRAKDLRADIYLACHVNATPKGAPLDKARAALLGYDHRSSNGRRLAQIVAAELGHLKHDDAKPIATDPGNWSAGMFHLIGGVFDGTPIGLTLEPLFIDQVSDEVWRTPSGLSQIGQAIARGVILQLAEL